MNKRKLFFAILGFGAIYFVAAGGTTALAEVGLVELFAAPLRRGNPFDVVLAMTAMIAFAFAAMPSDAALGRTSLLRGIALGSALITGVCAAALIVLSRSPDTAAAGVFALVMVAQAFVGLIAAALLFTRREDRSYAWAPLLINGTLASAAVALLLTPVL